MNQSDIIKALGAQEVRRRLLQAGWHEKRFHANRIIAINPVYADFGLSISDTWINGGMIEDVVDRWSLSIYPQDDLADILQRT